MSGARRTGEKRGEISVQSVVGKGYAEFWNFRGPYRVVKGSRASKKSKTTALWYIVHLLQHPAANLLVVRKVAETLRNSCYADLIWAMERLGVRRWFDCTVSPLEITYRPTGQKILFRGLDDPMKISSVSVPKGSLCWLWVEEAYEVNKEADFDMLDESIRGEVPRGLFKQITLTFNPWNERHWLKARFFDVPRPGVLAMTTNYEGNEWLDAADLAKFEAMKERNPRRYRVAGLGEWGIAEGLIYENFESEPFDMDAVRRIPGIKSAFGLDFGYTNDPTALFCGMVDEAGGRIFVFDEIYAEGLSNRAIFDAISAKNYHKERIVADSAEPKSIDELYSLGMTRITRARKGKDSINHGIQYIQNFKLLVHPKCKNFMAEVNNYAWATDPFGKRTNKPNGEFNHLMDAMRYALESMARKKTFDWE